MQLFQVSRFCMTKINNLSSVSRQEKHRIFINRICDSVIGHKLLAVQKFVLKLIYIEIISLSAIDKFQA